MGTVWAPSFLAEAARAADMLCLFSSPQRERDRTSRASATPGRSEFRRTAKAQLLTRGIINEWKDPQRHNKTSLKSFVFILDDKGKSLGLN